jgi:hypothetical protein
MPSTTSLLLQGALAVAACGAPPTDADLGAAQVAAATEVARRIARNPGPLETICVAYSGDWADPPLPTGVAGMAFAYGEGCRETDGQLFSLADGARAIWLGVGEPETSGSGAEVDVFTSTGIDDAAAYRCAVRREGGQWVAERCEEGAVG